MPKQFRAVSLKACECAKCAPKSVIGAAAPKSATSQPAPAAPSLSDLGNAITRLKGRK
jgi:hypothetical protein